VLLETADDAGHARRLHLFERGELAERDRTAVLDRGERAEARRGEVVTRTEGFAPDPAGEPRVHQPEPSRELLGCGRVLGRSCGFRADGLAHAG
jgi:hypothetical protein